MYKYVLGLLVYVDLIKLNFVFDLLFFLDVMWCNLI